MVPGWIRVFQLYGSLARLDVKDLTSENFIKNVQTAKRLTR